jgi:hypothetical protein
MKNENLTLITRIGWAVALLAAWTARAWNSDGSVIGVLIVVCGWTSVRIVSEGITASLLLMRADEDEE